MVTADPILVRPEGDPLAQHHQQSPPEINQDEEDDNNEFMRSMDITQDEVQEYHRLSKLIIVIFNLGIPFVIFIFT